MNPETIAETTQEPKISNVIVHAETKISEMVLKKLEAFAENIRRKVYIVNWASEKEDPVVFAKQVIVEYPNAFGILVYSNLKKYPIAWHKTNIGSKEVMLLNNHKCFNSLTDDTEILQMVEENIDINQMNIRFTNPEAYICWYNTYYAKFCIDGFQEYTDPDSSELFCGTVLHVLEQYLYGTHDMSEKKIRQSRDNFINFMRYSKTRVVDELQRKLRQLQSDSLVASERIWQLEKDTIITNKQLAYTKRQNSSFNRELQEKDINSIFKRLYDNMYTSIRFDTNYNVIKATTKDIKITWNGLVYNFGSFEVILSLNGTVKFAGGKLIGDVSHPHINAQIPCLGTMKETLPKMVASGDYLECLYVLYQFLCSYNHEGPFLKIETWRDHAVHKKIVSKEGEETPVLSSRIGTAVASEEDEDEQEEDEQEEVEQEMDREESEEDR